jgi:hypothetical protein
MSIVLRYDPVAVASGRPFPNVFAVSVEENGLYLLDMVVRATDHSPVHRCAAHVQVAERDEVRRRDRDGHVALLVRRVDERCFALENCQLHPALPRVAMLLVGWSPEAAP